MFEPRDVCRRRPARMPRNVVLLLSLMACVYVTTTDGLRSKRIRRQALIICSGPETFTELIRSVIEGNRKILEETQPLLLGDGENLIVVSLSNGRVFNAHTVSVRDTFDVRCNDTHMDLVFRIRLRRPVIVYDWVAPLGGIADAKGVLRVTMDDIDLDVGLLTAKNKKKTPGKPVITFLTIQDVSNLKFSFEGLGLVTAAVTALLGILDAVGPSVIQEVFAVLLERAFQRFVDSVDLPV